MIEMSKTPAEGIDLNIFKFFNVDADFTASNIVGWFFFHEKVKSGRRLNGVLHQKVSQIKKAIEKLGSSLTEHLEDSCLPVFLIINDEVFHLTIFHH